MNLESPDLSANADDPEYAEADDLESYDEDSSGLGWRPAQAGPQAQVAQEADRHPARGTTGQAGLRPGRGASGGRVRGDRHLRRGGRGLRRRRRGRPVHRPPWPQGAPVARPRRRLRRARGPGHERQRPAWLRRGRCRWLGAARPLLRGGWPARIRPQVQRALARSGRTEPGRGRSRHRPGGPGRTRTTGGLPVDSQEGRPGAGADQLAHPCRQPAFDHPALPRRWQGRLQRTAQPDGRPAHGCARDPGRGLRPRWPGRPAARHRRAAVTRTRQHAPLPQHAQGLRRRHAQDGHPPLRRARRRAGRPQRRPPAGPGADLRRQADGEPAEGRQVHQGLRAQPDRGPCPGQR